MIVIQGVHQKGVEQRRGRLQGKRERVIDPMSFTLAKEGITLGQCQNLIERR
jgi:hypothetical protein